MQDAPPNALFHYTTLPGIIGIAEKKRLWATSIRHLADASEFTYAHRMLEDALRARLSTVPEDVAATVNTLAFHLTHAGKSQLPFSGSIGSIFVTSFSTESDQLSQWRAYCPHGGYAMGFRTEILQKLAGEQGFELLRCSYDREAHAQACNEISGRVLEAVGKIPEGLRASLIGPQPPLTMEVMQALYPIQRQMLDDIQIHAPTWKDPSFREESEWRLVSLSSERKIKFRPGRTALVPYIEIRLDSDLAKVGKHHAVLETTVVGPCPEPELAVGSAMMLFEENWVAASSFSLSSTPHRSW